VVVVGGETASGPSNSCFLYDITQNTFTNAPQMSFHRSMHTANLLPSGQVRSQL
jgi:hypothetical protein